MLGRRPKALRQHSWSPFPALRVLLRALLGFADSPAHRLDEVAGEEEHRAPGPGLPGAPAGLVWVRISGLVSLPLGPHELEEDRLLGELELTVV